MGEPGTGKSRAILNLDPASTVILSPNTKDLPFRGAASRYNEAAKNYVKVATFQGVAELISKISEAKHIKTVVLEDLTHLFSNRVMQDAKIKTYDKWTDLAVDAFNALVKVVNSSRDDLWVIVLAHTVSSSDVHGNQIITLQTPGKLLENSIKIPSYFTYILHTDPMPSQDGTMQYRFLTNTDGIRIAKSPEGCLDRYEPNDYATIITKIETYQKS